MRVANADYRAASYEDTIRSLQARGVTSLNGLASELKAMGVLTPRGCHGQHQALGVGRASVYRVCRR